MLFAIPDESSKVSFDSTMIKSLTESEMEIVEALKVHFKDKPSFQRPICNFVAELYSNAHPNKRMKIQNSERK